MQTATTRPMKRLNSLTVALFLSFVGTTSLAAYSTTDEAYRDGYEAGYKAALKTARKAAAEGRTLDPEPVVGVGVGPISQLLWAAAAPAGKAAGTKPRPPWRAAKPEKPVAKAAGPADWWNHSALLYATMEDNWKHHLQVQMAGDSLTGNESGLSWHGGSKWFARYRRWTNELAATVDKRDVKTVVGSGTKHDYRMLQELLRYDLTNKWYVSGGFIWEKDYISLIDSRSTWIAGPGYYWLDSDKLRLKTFLGFGRLSESYMQFVRDNVGVDERSSNLLHLDETFEWRFARDWGLRQGFRLMRDLDESGRYVLDPVNPGSGRYVADSWVNRYRYIATVDLDYRLSPRSTLSFGIESRYDSNPWPDVLNKDSVKRIMLRFQF